MKVRYRGSSTVTLRKKSQTKNVYVMRLCLDDFLDREAKVKREEMTSDREEIGRGAMLEQRGKGLRSHTVHQGIPQELDAVAQCVYSKDNTIMIPMLFFSVGTLVYRMLLPTFRLKLSGNSLANMPRGRLLGDSQAS